MQSNTPYAELHDLLTRLCDAELDQPEWERLETLLLDNPDAQDYYSRFMALDVDLAWRAAGNDQEQEARDQGSEDGVQRAEDRGQRTDIQTLSPLPSLSTTHHPLPTTFIGGPVFSYMVATVVLCLMLLGAWAYKITHAPNIIATNSRRSTTSGSMDRPKMVVVGQITGMKDCHWSDPDTQTVVGASVSLDRQYALSSGLLEITYKSGAKVILEGPCTYRVESSAGGFLEHGKMTANIRGQRPEVRGRKSENSSFIPHPSYFVVKTPTAVVTDLGTEFGVEVSENGDTTSCVYQGTVKVEAMGGTGSASGTQTMLNAGESVLVSRVRTGTHQDSTTTKLVRFTHPTSPPNFVRRMPHITTAVGSMLVMDSADFAWKYEMDVDPVTQDLDANQGPDWTLLRGAVQVSGDGTATLAFAGDYSGCLISSGPGDPKHETGHVWNNIHKDTGYTVELRIKVVGTVQWYGHNLGLYFRAVDSTTESSSIVVITSESTLWDRISKYLIDNNRNDDDFHVFRIAQEPNSGKYHVWRDGVLVRLSEGFQPRSQNRVQFGDICTSCGPNEVDYVRITAGAYAPAKRASAAFTPDGTENNEEKMPMK